MKSSEINIRDPFVLVHDGTYYLYGTRGETAFAKEAWGFDVYTGTDLENWEGPFEVFHRPENFWSTKSYWAPEVYFYHDRFYMFATFEDGHKGLGTSVLVADSPKGPFTMWSTTAKTGYVEAIAHSLNNEIDGNWKVEEKLLYDHDGGHGMIFRDLNGQYRMTLHYPNTFRKEHPIFLPLEYKDGFVLKQE